MCIYMYIYIYIYTYIYIHIQSYLGQLTDGERTKRPAVIPYLKKTKKDQKEISNMIHYLNSVGGIFSSPEVSNIC